jgi:hypothetical protein
VLELELEQVATHTAALHLAQQHAEAGPLDDINNVLVGGCFANPKDSGQLQQAGEPPNEISGRLQQHKHQHSKTLPASSGKGQC